MRNRCLLLTVSVAFAAALPSAANAATCEDVEANPDWDGGFRYAARVKGEQLIVDFEVAPCFHAYGPRSQTGQPLAVELTGAAFTAAGPAKYPVGIKEKGPFGTRVVIRGKGRIVLPLNRVDEDAKRVQGKLHYHVCTDSACGPPRHVGIAATAG